MEHWYLPITILPGIGLLILSTSNLLISLSNEIAERLKSKSDSQMTHRKLSQLKLLNKGLVGLYIGAGMMVASGILSGLRIFYDFSTSAGLIAMLLGVVSVFVSITFLILYSLRAVKIRQDQYQESTE